MARLAFIGLGNMGAPMAANLLRAGHMVIGYDVNPIAVQALEQSGGRGAASAGEAVLGADAIFTMLPAGEQMRGVWTGLGGLIPHLAAAKETKPLLIDCSTIDVATARDVAEIARKAGFAMLDAPVSGGTAGAEAGTLTFMVGGDADAVERATPMLIAMGSRVVHAGVAGAGQAAKLCNNMILGISMIAVAEAFVLADRLGLDRQKLFDVASTSSGQCWSLTNYCPVPGPVPGSPANRDYAPGFAASLMLKDLRLAQDAAAKSGAATPLGARALALYQEAARAGLGDKDFSAIQPFLAERTRDG